MTIQIGSKVMYNGEWNQQNEKDFGFQISRNEVGTVLAKDIDHDGSTLWYVDFGPFTKKVTGHRGGKQTRKIEIQRKVTFSEKSLDMVKPREV